MMRPAPSGRATPRRAATRGRFAALLNEVETAQEYLVQQKPEIFDLNDEYPAGSGAYMIKDRDAYMEGLVASLRKMGLCAERDADDALQQTVRVKNSNDFSEDYDVILSSGHMRKDLVAPIRST